MYWMFRGCHIVSFHVPFDNTVFRCIAAPRKIGIAVDSFIISSGSGYTSVFVSIIGKCNNFRFAAATCDYRMAMDMPRVCHFIVRTYLGKVIKRFLLTPRGSEMAA